MRIIARLDVKNSHVIKGIQFDGLRKVGIPNALAKLYYASGIDEIVFIDCVASLYNRNNLFDIIRAASNDIFVPITIGGGIRTIDDVAMALDAGADKVAINTAAVKDPGFISQIARKYGSQCIVASIQSKRSSSGWEAYVESGRERTGLSVVDWALRLEELGAGEILLTSVDKDGTKSGFDCDISVLVNDRVNIPVTVSGGYGAPRHLFELLGRTQPSAVCFSSVLHYEMTSPDALKQIVATHG